MAEIKVDCWGETCPVPLVEVRKALRRAAPGDVVEVVGTHPASKKRGPDGGRGAQVGVAKRRRVGH